MVPQMVANTTVQKEAMQGRHSNRGFRAHSGIYLDMRLTAGTKSIPFALATIKSPAQKSDMYISGIINLRLAVWQ